MTSNDRTGKMDKCEDTVTLPRKQFLEYANPDYSKKNAYFNVRKDLRYCIQNIPGMFEDDDDDEMMDCRYDILRLYGKCMEIHGRIQMVREHVDSINYTDQGMLRDLLEMEIGLHEKFHRTDEKIGKIMKRMKKIMEKRKSE